MTASDRRRWTVAIFASMAVSGAALQLRGAILPTLATEYPVPEWQLGLVAPVGMIGYLLAVSAVGGLAGYLPARRYLLLGVFGSAVGLATMGLAPAFLVFLLGLLLQGSMEGVIRGLNRPLLSHLYPARRGRVFNYYDTIWAVGATAGPLLVVGAVALGDWRLAFFGTAAAALAVAGLFARLDAPEVESGEERLDREAFLGVLARPEIKVMAVALFFGTGVEGGLFTWLPYYATSELPATLAGVTLTVMLAAYVPGRLIYSRLAERIGPVNLLLTVTASLVPALLFTFVVADGLVLLAGVVAVGALVAGIYPTLILYGTETVPEHTGPVTAVAAVSSSLGVGLVPAVMGFVVGGSSATTAMRLLVLPLVVVLAVGLLARRAERSGPRASEQT